MNSEDQSSHSDPAKAATNIEFLRQIGAGKLAEEIERLRLAVHISEIEAIRNYYMTTYDLHQMKEDRLVSDVKTLNADFLNHSVNYNNIVAGLGYAGFIALLSIVKSFIFLEDFLLITLLLGMSLIVFVVWTSIQGYLFVRVVNKTSPLFLLPEGELDRRVILERYNQASQKRETEFAALQRFWPYSFVFSMVSGLVAAGVLLLSLAMRIFAADTGVVQHLFSILGVASGTLV